MCVVNAARLPNYRLAFSRFSSRRGCGVADVVHDEGHDVWGVVYEIIDPQDLDRLDRYEGVPNAYTRRSITVFLRGIPEQPVDVETYFAVKEPNTPLPSVEYKALIVRGAKFWRLPPEYIDELERIPCSRRLDRFGRGDL